MSAVMLLELAAYFFEHYTAYVTIHVVKISLTIVTNLHNRMSFWGKVQRQLISQKTELVRIAPSIAQLVERWTVVG